MKKCELKRRIKELLECCKCVPGHMTGACGPYIYVDSIRAILDPPEPAAPQPEQPYPWHPDVLNGKVSIVGGLVQDDAQSEPFICKGEYRAYLAGLRPAPHAWQVGDTAMVVSTFRTFGGDRDYNATKLGLRLPVACTHPDGKVYLSNSGVIYDPADLLYMPPSEQPIYGCDPASGVVASGTINEATGVITINKLGVPTARERLDAKIREDGVCSHTRALTAALDAHASGADPVAAALAVLEAR